MVRRIWSALAALVIIFTALGPAVATAQQTPTPEQARTFVGNISGLENIGARFVVIVSPERRSGAFLGSNDDNFNQTYAKWYTGEVNGNTMVATAADGTQLTLTLQGDNVTGTVAGGQISGTVSQRGTAGLYRSRISDTETDVAIVAPDGSWVGMAINPTNGQLIRTWNSGTGTVERIANSTRVRVQPAPNAPPIEMDALDDAPGDAFCNNVWC